MLSHHFLSLSRAAIFKARNVVPVKEVKEFQNKFINLCAGERRGGDGPPGGCQWTSWWREHHEKISLAFQMCFLQSHRGGGAVATGILPTIHGLCPKMGLWENEKSTTPSSHPVAGPSLCVPAR